MLYRNPLWNFQTKSTIHVFLIRKSLLNSKTENKMNHQCFWSHTYLVLTLWILDLVHFPSHSLAETKSPCQLYTIKFKWTMKKIFSSLITNRSGQTFLRSNINLRPRLKRNAPTKLSAPTNKTSFQYRTLSPKKISTLLTSTWHSNRPTNITVLFHYIHSFPLRHFLEINNNNDDIHI
jgi:hypothetical protein